jgi:hypothetical protein
VLRAQIALTCSRRRTQVEFALYQGIACLRRAGHALIQRKAEISQRGEAVPPRVNVISARNTTLGAPASFGRAAMSS